MKLTDSLGRSYARVVLVLQGGGALGAYQAGVYEGLAEAGYEPGWISGVSIGAVNAALIAGNPPAERVARLREFWHRVSAWVGVPMPPAESPFYAAASGASTALTAAFGTPGFFAPRVPPAAFNPGGEPAALSLYDNAPLRRTLAELVSFGVLNAGPTRVSVGAVDVQNGNSVYFDSRREKLDARHIVASGALPPAFAPVEIDGRAYWDGGIVSNTPLWYVLDENLEGDTLVFQVDLFSARGAMPRNLAQALERYKDIQYSSKTRLNTTQLRDLRRMRHALQRLWHRLPESLRADAELAALAPAGACGRVDIVHLINRRDAFTTYAKDFEFSAATLRRRWQAGLEDVRATLRHPEWLESTAGDEAVRTFDLARSGGARIRGQAAASMAKARAQ
jgi:NTE family protein